MLNIINFAPRPPRHEPPAGGRKAKRVERSSPRHAAYLRARARQLEEVTISAPAQASEELVLGEIDCPAMWRTPQARGLVPVQIVLCVPTSTIGTV